MTKFTVCFELTRVHLLSAHTVAEFYQLYGHVVFFAAPEKMLAEEIEFKKAQYEVLGICRAYVVSLVFY